jgi:lysophospholipase L1-like esterase
VAIRTSNTFTENFDGVTAPAIPASITVDSGIVTDTGFAVSALNSLADIAGTVAYKGWETASAVGASDGNDRVVLYIRTATATGLAGVILGITSSMLGALATGVGYYFRLNSATDCSLYKLSGTGTAGATLLGSGTFTQVTGVTYMVEFIRAYDAAGGAWLSVAVQRLSDNFYLTLVGNSYSFNVAYHQIIRVRDTTVAAASQKIGGVFRPPGATSDIFADDLSLDRVWAVTWLVFGDSTADGFLPAGATNGLSWPRQLEALIPNGTIQNNGKNSWQTGDVANWIASIPANKCMTLVGINDLTTPGYGTDATKMAYRKSSLMALACRAGLPTIVKAQAATAAGTWTNVTTSPVVAYDQVTTRSSNVSGSTLTFTVSGTAVYVAYSGMSDLAGTVYTGTADVTIDGVFAGSITSAKPGIRLTHNGLNRDYFIPQVDRFGGLAAGSHTVVITTTNGTGNNTMFVDWVAGNTQTSYKPVLIGEIQYLTAAGYASRTNPTTGIAPTAAEIDSYNADSSSVVSALAGDGLIVKLVDLHTGWNPTTMDSSDGIHPNHTTGAAYNAAQFLAATASKTVITTQPTTVASGVTFGTNVVVSLKDEDDNVVTGDVTSVTLTLNVLTGSVVLSGTTTKAAVAGVATFNDLSVVCSDGATFTLTATDGPLTAATTTTITATASGTTTTYVPTHAPIIAPITAPIRIRNT